MTSTDIIDTTLDELNAALQDNEQISLLLVRNMHKLLECQFHANCGNDHIILKHRGAYHYIRINNGVIGKTMVETGLGEVIDISQHADYCEALTHCLDIIKEDNCS